MRMSYQELSGWQCITEPHDEGSAAPAAEPAIAFFDHVLADVGDGQSLQQSLSTFSGHVRRASRVLATATPASLVLLDEVSWHMCFM